MKTLFIFFVVVFLPGILPAQVKTDSFLKDLIDQQASPLLKSVLDQPDTFQYQLIYTQINRDANNQPSFTNYYLNEDRLRYFNPASMVKLPTVLCALEKLQELRAKGIPIDINTTMLTDSSYGNQVSVAVDTSSANGKPSIAQYIRRIFLISDNEAYNRLYEFVGQKTLNEKLWQKGYRDSRITRRFVTMTEDQNRHTNAIRFVKDSQLLYRQEAAYNKDSFDFRRTILMGWGHFDDRDSLIKTPMDFTRHNQEPLENLQKMLQSVLFPTSVPAHQRFNISEADRRFLLQYMSELPSESEHPRYDTAEYFDSYTKFFWFKSDREKIPDSIRVFNKTGWSFGFLTDVAYIVDFKNHVEFMVSGVIYTNSDGVLNDNKYEYEQTGYPFFKEIGQILYHYELQRLRPHIPNLDAFRFDHRGPGIF